MLPTVEEFRERLGTEVGPSAWEELTQERVDAFAELTGDRDWLHNEPERATSEGPFGGPIVQGFFMLSLLTDHMNQFATDELADLAYALNYGFNRVRFVAPVLVGSKVRIRGKLAELEARDDGRMVFTLAVTMENDSSDRPALVADWLFLISL